ncbi:MAG: NAD(P)-binding domain-containing protein [Rhodospirillales bacterium]|nr:NAD(P)-binding domain-containing protein [Rhodospirillales bacterium]
MASIGLIGIGNLGLAVACNLIARGHRVIGYRRSRMDAFVAAGGVAAASPAAAAAEAEVVLTCLPDGEALGAVVDEPGGLLSGGATGKAVFELGSFSMPAREAVRASLSKIGTPFLDCAVSGNPNYMRARTAAIFVSGDADIFDAHRPILEDITENVSHVGAFGAGTALKAVVTALIPVHTLAAAEAFALATRAGLDRRVVFDAIAGTPASSGMFETRGKAMIDGEHSRAVSIEGYLKNIGIATELAGSVGGDYPLFATMKEVFERTIAAGLTGVDQSVVFDYLMRGDGAQGPEV